jgi:transcriptional regulator with XRE-family HTH domain
MSQNELAKRVMKGRSYINYVVSGKNRTAKNKQSKPGPASVERIARALDIPVDDAFKAAGWPQYVGKSLAKADTAKGADRAIKVVRPSDAGTGAASEVRIDLAGKMHLILVSEGGPLTGEQIDRYSIAFRTAAEIVRK